MSLTVVSDNESAPDVQSVIAILQEAIQEAKDGKLIAVVLGKVRPEGSLNADWSESSACATEMLAASTLLQHRLVQYLDDNPAYDDERPPAS